MQPILTLTVNPALDVSTATEQVISGHKLRCGASRLDAGGGGVNVSRVVQRLGGRTLAVYTAGGPTGEAYRRLIEAERVPTLAVPIQGVPARTSRSTRRRQASNSASCCRAPS